MMVASVRPHALAGSYTPPPRSLAPPPPLQVSPFHAAILLHFQSRAEWPAEELAGQLGVTPEALRRKIILWMNAGAHSSCRSSVLGDSA